MENYKMFRNLLVMAAADQKFTEEEIALLAGRATRWGITDEQFDEALAYTDNAEATVVVPEEPDEQQRLLKNLLEVMAADGELAPVEKRLFALAAAKMGFSGEDLGRLLDEMLAE